ncbi:hypothetical protein ACH5RR_021267 [Cinchona calisaya]|uniref:Uncharacterized protein n=1 Tax=Cinchona calisaya TaxID=153742 RepID=A0ABD2ZI21_9GENT
MDLRKQLLAANRRPSLLYDVLAVPIANDVYYRQSFLKNFRRLIQMGWPRRTFDKPGEEVEKVHPWLVATEIPEPPEPKGKSKEKTEPQDKVLIEEVSLDPNLPDRKIKICATLPVEFKGLLFRLLAEYKDIFA